MQELQRTPLAEEVGILAAGDLALRFVEWFGFEELARTGARVNKRWHAASLVFAPPEAEFKVQHKEIFDGYQTLGAWSHAHGISHAHEFPGSNHPSVANPCRARIGATLQRSATLLSSCGAT